MSRRPPPVLLLATAVLFCAAAAGAAPRLQPPDEDAAAVDSDVTERVEVLLVQLPFLALDRHGRPVTDLTADEIVVEAGGERMEVDYLERPRDREAASGPLPPVRLHVDLPGGWSVPEASAAGTPEHLVLFLDVQNDERLGRHQALEQLVEFIREDLDPSQHVSVFSFDGELHVDLPFTNEKEAIVSAVRSSWERSPRARMNLESRVNGLVRRMEECAVQSRGLSAPTADPQCVRDVAREYAEEAKWFAMGFLDALHYLVEYLGGIEGRTAVYALSHGVEVDATRVIVEAARSVFGHGNTVSGVQLYIGFGSSPQHRMNEVQRLAVQNGVALYFVDRTRAPTADFGAKAARMGQPGTFPAREAWAAAQADLEEIATSTGGVFRANTNLGKALDQLELAREGLYEVGYRARRRPDGTVPRPKLSVTRRGVRLTHREGVPRRSSARPRPAAGRVELGLMDREPGPGAVGLAHEFTIRLDPRQLGYAEGEAEVTTDFTLHMLVEDDQGRQRAGSYHFVNHAYPLDRWRAGAVEPLTVFGWVELPAGSWVLRPVFRSVRTGWTGQLSTAITVLDTGEAAGSKP